MIHVGSRVAASKVSITQKTLSVPLLLPTYISLDGKCYNIITRAYQSSTGKERRYYLVPMVASRRDELRIFLSWVPMGITWTRNN